MQQKTGRSGTVSSARIGFEAVLRTRFAECIKQSGVYPDFRRYEVSSGNTLVPASREVDCEKQ